MWACLSAGGMPRSAAPAHYRESAVANPPDRPGTMQRRSLLKKAAAAGAVFWTAPAIDSFLSVAAATSRDLTVPIVKTVNSNQDLSLSTICTAGGVGNSIRGSATFARRDNAGTICVEITLTTGTSAVGREVFILQSRSSTQTCLGLPDPPVPVRTWAASPQYGPQTFCAPLVSGADTFVVALQLSGGGGVDGWSSHLASLP